MATMYCALCRRPVDAKRRIGVGTIALAVLTGGLWLLAIPFYEKRCAICRSAAVSATAPDEQLAGGASPASQRRTLETRIADLEQRLSLTEGEVEATSIEIERLRAERDFDRQLLGNPTARRQKEESGSE
ncbi:MAG TPA: hypothetical protein VMN39_03130 [Longimicrobiaceae bacterium]|nr:hypothetical protein [Longimicrobiaceae bacterium]